MLLLTYRSYLFSNISVPIDIERLRSGMIGTTKIVSKDDTPIPVEWGPTCRLALEKIWDHKAYASRRYYYHTYKQYFTHLYASFESLTKMLRKRAQGIIVIQNSFYKDVNIPTPSIASGDASIVGVAIPTRKNSVC